MCKLFRKSLKSCSSQVFSILLSFVFINSFTLSPSHVYAQGAPTDLPSPRDIKSFSAAYRPPVITAIKVNAEDPLKFDFIVDRGDSGFADKVLEDETQKLIKYFLGSLTTPDSELWVNLSPYEKDLMIPYSLGMTELGKTMLSQDYLLKQITASLTNPENEIGKKFWERVYKKAFELYGTTEIPINTFSKVWIVPKRTVVLEKEGTAFVADNYLTVMLEEDYLAIEKNINNKDIGTDLLDQQRVAYINNISSQFVNEVILPELEKEINEGQNFAPIRQVFNSVILATWYKQRLKESLLSKVYVDQNKVSGVDVDDKTIKEKIYDQYMTALQEGVYNMVREDVDVGANGTVQRKYFSGGMAFQKTGENLVKVGSPINLAPETRKAVQQKFNDIQNVALSPKDNRPQFVQVSSSLRAAPQITTPIDERKGLIGIQTVSAPVAEQILTSTTNLAPSEITAVSSAIARLSEMPANTFKSTTGVRDSLIEMGIRPETAQAAVSAPVLARFAETNPITMSESRWAEGQGMMAMQTASTPVINSAISRSGVPELATPEAVQRVASAITNVRASTPVSEISTPTLMAQVLVSKGGLNATEANAVTSAPVLRAIAAASPITMPQAQREAGMGMMAMQTASTPVINSAISQAGVPEISTPEAVQRVASAITNVRASTPVSEISTPTQMAQVLVSKGGLNATEANAVTSAPVLRAIAAASPITMSQGQREAGMGMLAMQTASTPVINSAISQAGVPEISTPEAVQRVASAITNVRASTPVSEISTPTQMAQVLVSKGGLNATEANAVTSAPVLRAIAAASPITMSQGQREAGMGMLAMQTAYTPVINSAISQAGVPEIATPEAVQRVASAITNVRASTPVSEISTPTQMAQVLVSKGGLSATEANAVTSAPVLRTIAAASPITMPQEQREAGMGMLAMQTSEMPALRSAISQAGVPEIATPEAVQRVASAITNVRASTPVSEISTPTQMAQVLVSKGGLSATEANAVTSAPVLRTIAAASPITMSQGQREAGMGMLAMQTSEMPALRSAISQAGVPEIATPEAVQRVASAITNVRASTPVSEISTPTQMAQVLVSKGGLSATEANAVTSAPVLRTIAAASPITMPQEQREAGMGMLAMQTSEMPALRSAISQAGVPEIATPEAVQRVASAITNVRASTPVSEISTPTQMAQVLVSKGGLNATEANAVTSAPVLRTIAAASPITMPQEQREAGMGMLAMQTSEMPALRSAISQAGVPEIATPEAVQRVASAITNVRASTPVSEISTPTQMAQVLVSKGGLNATEANAVTSAPVLRTIAAASPITMPQEQREAGMGMLAMQTSEMPALRSAISQAGVPEIATPEAVQRVASAITNVRASTPVSEISTPTQMAQVLVSKGGLNATEANAVTSAPVLRTIAAASPITMPQEQREAGMGMLAMQTSEMPALRSAISQAGVPEIATPEAVQRVASAITNVRASTPVSEISTPTQMAQVLVSKGGLNATEANAVTSAPVLRTIAAASPITMPQGQREAGMGMLAMQTSEMPALRSAISQAGVPEIATPEAVQRVASAITNVRASTPVSEISTPTQMAQVLVSKGGLNATEANAVTSAPVLRTIAAASPITMSQGQREAGMGMLAMQTSEMPALRSAISQAGVPEIATPEAVQRVASAITNVRASTPVSEISTPTQMAQVLVSKGGLNATEANAVTSAPVLRTIAAASPITMPQEQREAGMGMLAMQTSEMPALRSAISQAGVPEIATPEAVQRVASAITNVRASTPVSEISTPTQMAQVLVSKGGLNATEANAVTSAPVLRTIAAASPITMPQEQREAGMGMLAMQTSEMPALRSAISQAGVPEIATPEAVQRVASAITNVRASTPVSEISTPTQMAQVLVSKGGLNATEANAVTSAPVLRTIAAASPITMSQGQREAGMGMLAMQTASTPVINSAISQAGVPEISTPEAVQRVASAITNVRASTPVSEISTPTQMAQVLVSKGGLNATEANAVTSAPVLRAIAAASPITMPQEQREAGMGMLAMQTSEMPALRSAISQAGVPEIATPEAVQRVASAITNVRASTPVSEISTPTQMAQVLVSKGGLNATEANAVTSAPVLRTIAAASPITGTKSGISGDTDE